MKKNMLRFILIIISILALAACNKDKGNDKTQEETDTFKDTEQLEENLTTDPENTPTSVPEPDMPEASVTPEVTEPAVDIDDSGKTGSEEGSTSGIGGNADNTVTKQSALNALLGYISEALYDIELTDENALIDGKNYYIFQVSSEGEIIKPLIAVNKKDASIHYYENGSLMDFNGFPLDKVEIAEADDNIELDEAVKKLSEVPEDKLKLNKPLSSYEIETDPWTTIVNGEQCYCVNLFDDSSGSRQLAAVFYVSIDGNTVYHLEGDNNFKDITK